MRRDIERNYWEKRTTRLTEGALFLMALRIPVVPIIAGSRRSFFVSVTLKWKGLAVWMTASNGGSDMTALSKAPSCAISSTMAKERSESEALGWASLILEALA